MKHTIWTGLLLLGLVTLPLVPAWAHCDTLDGPVVTAARQALETGNVKPVLAWVRPQDEPEITAALTQARQVRPLGPQAQALADRWFFETVVRVHRAGEGAPYTGLKPAGTTDPVVAAADRALQARQAAPLVTLLTTAVREGVESRLHQVLALQPKDANDVAASRAWVHAYVDYVHYMEAVATAAARGAGEHAAAAQEGGEHEGH